MSKTKTHDVPGVLFPIIFFPLFRIRRRGGPLTGYHSPEITLTVQMRLRERGHVFNAQCSGHDGCERKLKCLHVLESGGEAIPICLGL